MSDDEVLRVVALVCGQVQGVGYRWFVRGLAQDTGLSGWARNLPDGRVEVVLEGAARAVHDVVGALDGPSAPGTVDEVVVTRQPVQGVQGFSTL